MTRFHDPVSLFSAVAAGDPEAREQAILDHMPLVRALVRRHGRSSEPTEDLMQIGTLALIGAVDRYDPQRGGSFASFAIPTINGELLRHFRDRTGAVRLPRAVSDARRAVVAAAAEIRAQAGHEPSIEELSAETRIGAAGVREALSAPELARAVPYWGEEGAAGPAERLGADDPGFAAAEARADLTDAMEGLPDRERVILHLRFRADLTQSEIAQRVGVSQMHVSRLLRRSIATLRARIDHDADLRTASAA